MGRSWTSVVVCVGTFALSACSVVLDPEDYVGDGEEDGGGPPPVAPPPPGACDPLPVTTPPWRGCPYMQVGPASFDLPLMNGDLSLALAPGGESVRAFGAISTVGPDGHPTIGTFSLDDINLSNPFDLTGSTAIVDVRSVALRAEDENNIAINLIGGSFEDTTVRAWIGRVTADDAFEMNPIYAGDSELFARASIVGGYMPSPALQVFPVRHVWRSRDMTGDRLGSVDSSGALESAVASMGDVPAGDRVEVSGSSGQWIALSTSDAVQLWRADANGTALSSVSTDARTGRAVIAAAGTGCHYAVAYPRIDGLALVPLRCNAGCTTLEADGDETFLPTEGEPSLPSLAPMPEGGWALAAAERRDGANPVVVVRLLRNDFTVQVTLDPLSATGDLTDSSYLDVQVAATQRGARFDIVVAASHDQGSAGSATPHWIASFGGCGE